MNFKYRHRLMSRVVPRFERLFSNANLLDLTTFLLEIETKSHPCDTSPVSLKSDIMIKLNYIFLFITEIPAKSAKTYILVSCRQLYNPILCVVRRKMPASAFLLINLAVSDLFLLANAPMKIILELNLNMFTHLGTEATRPFLCKE